MLYRILEHLRGQPVSVHRRFRDQGRLVPEGSAEPAAAITPRL
jgi:hypothetical protein